jgi:hypothetical protein
MSKYTQRKNQTHLKSDNSLIVLKKSPIETDQGFYIEITKQKLKQTTNHQPTTTNSQLKTINPQTHN